MLLHTWVLSKQYRTSAGEVRPVAKAYAINTFMPESNLDEDGWHLCFVRAGAHQLEAAKADPRVQVFKTSFSKITPEAAQTYAHYGAVEGMSLGELIEAISEHEPLFLMDASAMM